MMRSSVLAAALALAAGGAAAAPKVAADIAPVHSLVAAVMQGVGEPALILPPGASPHGHAMRPSEARALQEAELVFWIGPQLTPWLDGPLDELAGRAATVALRDAPGVVLLPVREGATFEAHDHGHGHGHGHDHGHGRGTGHAHDHGLADHDEAAMDEHLWLDPENAKLWLGVIAEALAQADPANAAAYAANAAAAVAAVDAAAADVAERLRRVRGLPFVVFHDAYQYFEARFGVPAAGSVTVSDAAPPGAARMAEIRRLLKAADAGCIFAEPQFPGRVVAAVVEGTGARTGVLDPLGADQTPGPALYPAVLRGLADALAGCLAP